MMLAGIGGIAIASTDRISLEPKAAFWRCTATPFAACYNTGERSRVWREGCQVLGGESLDSSTGSRGQHQLALPSSSSSGQQAKALMNEAWVENVVLESVECGRCFLYTVRLGPSLLRQRFHRNDGLLSLELQLGKLEFNSPLLGK